MIPLFVGLTLVNLVCLASAVTIGYLSAFDDPSFKSWHLLAGTLATLACCAVHCIVFTYFMATAKWVQHAVTLKGLDPALTAPTRSFRAQALPAALLAIAVVFATAILGAAHDNYGLSSVWHQAGSFASIAINGLAAAIEYRTIAQNGLLIDRVLESIEQQRALVPAV